MYHVCAGTFGGYNKVVDLLELELKAVVIPTLCLWNISKKSQLLLISLLPNNCVLVFKSLLFINIKQTINTVSFSLELKLFHDGI